MLVSPTESIPQTPDNLTGLSKDSDVNMIFTPQSSAVISTVPLALILPSSKSITELFQLSILSMNLSCFSFAFSSHHAVITAPPPMIDMSNFHRVFLLIFHILFVLCSCFFLLYIVCLFYCLLIPRLDSSLLYNLTVLQIIRSKQCWSICSMEHTSVKSDCCWPTIR